MLARCNAFDADRAFSFTVRHYQSMLCMQTDFSSMNEIATYAPQGTTLLIFVRLLLSPVVNEK
jgi:hypothetical protein